MPLTYGDKSTDDLLQQMYRSGFTQEGVNELYSRLGLPDPPTVPASLIGVPLTQTRFGLSSNGRLLDSASQSFFNSFRGQAEDPYRTPSAISQVAGAALPIAMSFALGGFGANGLAGGGAANALSGVKGMGWDWGRVLDYGIPLVGSFLEGQGAKDASRASSAAAQAGIAENRRQFDQTRADMMPWLNAGTAALGRLNDPNAFTASPDYNFRRTEGMRGIENSFSASGGALSGNALRALTDFNSNLASGEFGNWWNRTASQAGLGQTAANNLGSLGANSSANIANLLGAQGDARASGIMGQTNALTGLLQNLSSVYNRRNTKPVA